MSKKVLLFCACMVFAGYANASSEADKERENTVENEIFTNDADEPAGFITFIHKNGPLGPTAQRFDAKLPRTAEEVKNTSSGNIKLDHRKQRFFHPVRCRTGLQAFRGL